MKFGLYFLMALGNMVQHKLRTLLTLLGLIVGISSVLVMTGIGRGFGESTEEQLATLLPNKITLRQGYSPDTAPVMLTLREVDLLQSMIGRAAISAVAPSKQLWDLAIKGVDPNMQPAMVTATSADYPQMKKFIFSRGRFFSAAEERESAFVAVINQGMFDLLKQTGQRDLSVLTIDNKPFRIVGVTQADEGMFSFGIPEAYIPISLLQRYLSSQSIQIENGALAVDEINVLAVDVERLEPAKRDIERILRLRYGLRAEQMNNFDLSVEGDILGFAQDFSNGFTLVLGGIGAVALIVGGIGIMNILLAGVSERTREIGLRKAIGASNRDILFQFLFEAITICLVGGLLGVGVSYGIGSIINAFAGEGSMVGLHVVIDLRSVFIAAGSSIACGVIFGLYPALRAMRLNPIQALRYE